MTTPHPPLATSPQDELAGNDRWALIGRVVASSYFSKAAQLRELLVYLGRRAILSASDDITEQEIGWRVLGRKQDYDPQADNIVRVQIRRLRQKLDEYFTGDGCDEPLVISIPKGSHVVHFELRPTPAPQGVLAPVAPPAKPRGVWLTKALPIVTLVILSVLLGGYYGRSTRDSIPLRRPVASPLWARMFVPDQSTSVVMADSSLVIIQNVLHKNVTLSDYIDHSYQGQIEGAMDPAIRDVLRMIAGRQYTSLADATLASGLCLMGQQFGSRVAVRFARHMNIRDFSSGNHILIGSSHGVPWVELFEPNLNFQFGPVGKNQRFGFRNKKPVDAEPREYISEARTGGSQENFATISLTPNLAHNGTVLMLNGVTMEATEAAGEFAMSSDFSSFLVKTFGASSPEKLPYFQVLLKAASMAGAPHKVDVVTWRKLDY